jgi:hypothetical protein
VRTEPTPATPATPDPVPRPSTIGVRTFDAINETFSQITGVRKNTAPVRNTYLNVKQALPAAETFQAFLASHQTAVAQLAVAYCSEMVNSDSLRSAFYGSDLRGSPLATADQRNAIIYPAIDRAMGTGLLTQPAREDMRAELDLLIHNPSDATRALGMCQRSSCASSSGNTGRTALVMKAVCGAALASAVTTVQ